MGNAPAYLPSGAEIIAGDVRDAKTVRLALDGVSAVYHFAAAVGVGQSMYEIVNYTNINADGTAVLLEALAQRPLERLVVASSMSIYGEGLYRRADGTRLEGRERSLEQLRAHDWEVRDERRRGTGVPVGTPETKHPSLPSVYALSKYYQERLCMTVGRAYGIPTVGLRFFNIYGTRQALSNPYTGVLAIFAARYLNDKPPLINEDGEQRRDFVSVRDIAQACRLALEIPGAADHVFNVGSGHDYSVREIAEKMARVLGKSHLEPEIVGKCRVGDIRNCFADITPRPRGARLRTAGFAGRRPEGTGGVAGGPDARPTAPPTRRANCNSGGWRYEGTRGRARGKCADHGRRGLRRAATWPTAFARADGRW